MAEPAQPTVSVLMTTWNGAGCIGAAIASVLAQRFTDFELLVVDDASTDGTPEVLAAIRDPRLRVLRQAVNGGVVAARNAGYAVARGRYIAALDHDDLSHPDRLAHQVAYLDANPQVVLVATEIEIEALPRQREKQIKWLPLPLREGAGEGVATPWTIDRTRHRHVPDHPTGGDPTLIRWLLHIDNPLTWSSVMFRADAIRALGTLMRPDYELADDFDLYHRLLAIGDIARLDEALTIYRWHASNTTYGREDALNANAIKVLAAAYAPWLGDAAADAATLVIRHLSDRKPVRDGATLERLGACLAQLLVAFCTTHDLTAPRQASLRAVTGHIWWRSVRAAVRSGAPALLRQYRAQPVLAAASHPGYADMVASVLVGLVRWGLGRTQ